MRLFLILLLTVVSSPAQYMKFDGFERDTGGLTNISSTYWEIATTGTTEIGLNSSTHPITSRLDRYGMGRTGFPALIAWTDATGLSNDQQVAGAVLNNAAVALRIDAAGTGKAYVCRGGDELGNTSVRIMTLSDGSETTLGSTFAQSVDGDILHFKVSGSTLQCDVYSRTTFALKGSSGPINDTTITAGKVGFGSYSATSKGLFWWYGGDLAGCDLVGDSSSSALFSFSRTDYFMSPTATYCGHGTKTSPFNVFAVFSRPELVEGTGGDRTVWSLGVNGATSITNPATYYSPDKNILNVSGMRFPFQFTTTSSQRIRFRNYPGRAMTFVSPGNSHPTQGSNSGMLGVLKHYTEIVGATILFDDRIADKIDEVAGSNPPTRRSDAISNDFDFGLVANSLAFGGGQHASNNSGTTKGNKWYWNLQIAPGYDAPDREHGSCWYVRTNDLANPAEMIGNFCRDAAFLSMRVTGGSALGVIVKYNASFGNSGSHFAGDPGVNDGWVFQNNIFTAVNNLGNPGVGSMTLDSNLFLNGLTTGAGSATTKNGIFNITNNKFVGLFWNQVDPAWSGTATVDGNQVYTASSTPYKWGTQTYANITDWRSAGTTITGTAFDATGTLTTSTPSTNFTMMTPENDYEPRRCMFYLINYQGLTSYNLDLTPCGYAAGDQYQIEDIWELSAGVKYSGTFNGTAVALDLTDQGYDDPGVGVDDGWGTQCWNSGDLSDCAAQKGWLEGAGSPVAGCTFNNYRGSGIYRNTTNNRIWYCGVGGNWNDSGSSGAVHGATTFARNSTQFGFLIRQLQIYRPETNISIPYRSTATTAVVTWTTKLGGPQIGPDEPVTLAGSGPTPTSIAQPVGTSWYTITYSDGFVTSPLKASAY